MTTNYPPQPLTVDAMLDNVTSIIHVDGKEIARSDFENFETMEKLSACFDGGECVFYSRDLKEEFDTVREMEKAFGRHCRDEFYM